MSLKSNVAARRNLFDFERKYNNQSRKKNYI